MTADLFVTGTDTNVGKTLLSALLVAALDGIYWKPIQTGSREGTDRQTVMRLAEISEDTTVARNLLLRSAGLTAPGGGGCRRHHSVRTAFSGLRRQGIGR